MAAGGGALCHFPVTDRDGEPLRATAAPARIPVAMAGEPPVRGCHLRTHALRFNYLAGTPARQLLPDVAPAPRQPVAPQPRGMAIRQSRVTADFHPIAEAIRRLS